MTSRWSNTTESIRKGFSQADLNDLIHLLNHPITLAVKPDNIQYEGIVHRATRDGVFLTKVKGLSEASEESLFIPASSIRSYFRGSALHNDDNATEPASTHGAISSLFSNLFPPPTSSETNKTSQKGDALVEESHSEHASDNEGDASGLDHPVYGLDTRFYRFGYENHNTEMLSEREAHLLEAENWSPTRSEERARQELAMLQTELAILRDKLATQERGRREESALIMERLNKAQAENRMLREKVNILERERKEERERMTALLHQILPLHLAMPSMIDALPKYLQGKNAQIVVDYLSDMLNLDDIFNKQGERKRALHLLCKIAKSAQVYPKAVELTGVECDFSESINEGGFGVIYKGTFRGRPVCIKAVRMYQVGAKERALRAHAGELVLGTHVFHPNIIPFYGAFMSGEKTPRMCITTPWIERGNLVDYLRQYPDTSRILLVSDILSGLGHLHEMAIVHADLKGYNVLISHAQRAILADFGVSRIAMTSAGTTTAADSLGTLHWMAPELLTCEDPLPATRESDMWAFGCVCYEILAGKIPFEEYKPVQLMRAFDLGNLTPSRPDSKISIPYANEIWSLAEMCFDYDPGKRPTANAALKVVLDLNTADNRPPVKDPKWFFKRSRSPAELNYAALASIIRQVNRINREL